MTPDFDVPPYYKLSEEFKFEYDTAVKNISEYSLVDRCPAISRDYSRYILQPLKLLPSVTQGKYHFSYAGLHEFVTHC